MPGAGPDELGSRALQSTIRTNLMKQLILAGVCSLGLFTSCLGPNNAHNSIRNWNVEISDQDWVNEVVFLGFTIIPVYGFAYLGDILIFNTMGYWAENPINDPGPYPEGFKNGSKD